MYLLKVIEKMLTHNESNKPELNTPLNLNYSLFNGEDIYLTTEENTSKKHTPLNYNDTNHNLNQINSVYCLFVNSKQSFIALHNNIKKKIIVNNIVCLDNDIPDSKNDLLILNKYIQNKVVFLNIISENEFKEIIADVFLDKEKTHSINSILTKLCDKNITKSF